jgi:CheY-like chemotaxis protein
MKTVLVVEDGHAEQQLISSLLLRSGFDVILAMAIKSYPTKFDCFRCDYARSEWSRFMSNHSQSE